MLGPIVMLYTKLLNASRPHSKRVLFLAICEGRCRPGSSSSPYARFCQRISVLHGNQRGMSKLMIIYWNKIVAPRLLFLLLSSKRRPQTFLMSLKIRAAQEKSNRYYQVNESANKIKCK
jgi:hypothetical protein